jgi:glycosyltransferase involved in cell wall biosynthesis
VARQLTFAYPGDLNTLTGGYIYDKQMVTQLRALGWQVDTLGLDPRFPMVSDQVRELTSQRLTNVAPHHQLVIDGLALGALGEHARLIANKRAFIALVHHPLALESGLDADTAQALRHSEQRALSYAQGIIVSSPTTKQTLVDDFAVDPHKIVVIVPGTDQPTTLAKQTSRVSDATHRVQLLSVGAIVPRKGFDVLIDALAGLGHLNWHLTIVGDDQRAPQTSAALRQLIVQHGLEQRVSLTGTQAASELAEHYARADVFVLASRYEGYGMAYTEALAWGLPVIGTNAGAGSDTLATAGAQTVPPDNTQALAQVLDDLIGNAGRRADMRLAALAYAKTLASWQDSGRRFADTLNQMHTR